MTNVPVITDPAVLRRIAAILSQIAARRDTR